MAYVLPKILSKKLELLGFDKEEQEREISTLEEEAKVYFSLFFDKDIVLNNKELKLLSDLYIQYSLFAKVEMESLSVDKKEMLDNLLEKISDRYIKEKEKLEEEKNKKKRIKVY